MARHRSLLRRGSSSLLLLLLIGPLLLSSSATECGGWSRKLLVTAPRVSPETRSLSGSQQEMYIGGWRWATPPFRRAGASLGRRVPGSHANPSHN